MTLRPDPLLVSESIGRKRPVTWLYAEMHKGISGGDLTMDISSICNRAYETVHPFHPTMVQHPGVWEFVAVCIAEVWKLSGHASRINLVGDGIFASDNGSNLATLLGNSTKYIPQIVRRLVESDIIQKDTAGIETLVKSGFESAEENYQFHDIVASHVFPEGDISAKERQSLVLPAFVTFSMDQFLRYVDEDVLNPENPTEDFKDKEILHRALQRHLMRAGMRFPSPTKIADLIADIIIEIIEENDEEDAEDHLVNTLMEYETIIPLFRERCVPVTPTNPSEIDESYPLMWPPPPLLTSKRVN